MIDVLPKPNCPGWSAAERHLSRADPILAHKIAVVGPCTLAPRTNYFACLAQSVISQQISTRVADVIYGRFRDLFPARRPSAARLGDVSDDELRAIGLSRQKAAYIRSLAEAFASRDVPVARFRSMADEAVIEALTPIKGVGRWTAEMFLIFVLNRTDVLPVGDLGLCKSVQDHYGLPKYPSAEQVRAIAEPWRPYRSIATWYLWRFGSLPPALRAS